MQPISMNASPLGKEMMEAHLAKASAMGGMADQMNAMGGAFNQQLSQASQVTPAVSPANTPASIAQTHPPAEGVFDNVLGKFVHEVNDKHTQMGSSLRAMLAGENVPLHQVMTEFQEAGVAFTMMVELRNKLLESYKTMISMGL
jgi:flagellar hook-basal body complex protein FliE|tara:strand:- start:29 stop:460 length:432 start_codon:yes stop_codon:yes gene_type:complete